MKPGLPIGAVIFLTGLLYAGFPAVTQSWGIDFGVAAEIRFVTGVFFFVAGSVLMWTNRYTEKSLFQNVHFEANEIRGILAEADKRESEEEL